MARAVLRSSSPALTSATALEISALMARTSALGLARAALDAALRRFSAFSGAWAQQSPCDPLAGKVQGSPFALVARHTSICGPTPFYESRAVGAGAGGEDPERILW